MDFSRAIADSNWGASDLLLQTGRNKVLACRGRKIAMAITPPKFNLNDV
jgi:hypothetical protein